MYTRIAVYARENDAVMKTTRLYRGIKMAACFERNSMSLSHV